MTTATLSPSLLSQEERTNRAFRDVCEDIRWAFVDGVRRVPISRLTLPGTDLLGRREVPKSMEQVIADDISDMVPWAAFKQVLANSDCPYVAQLRAALATNYADSHADEVAAIRSEA